MQHDILKLEVKRLKQQLTQKTENLRLVEKKAPFGSWKPFGQLFSRKNMVFCLEDQVSKASR